MTRQRPNKNIDISPVELASIRTLPDFDLKMLLSEIEDFGWQEGGKRLLPMILEAIAKDAAGIP